MIAVRMLYETLAETPAIVKPLNVGEQGAHAVQPDEEQQHRADVAEVDALGRAGDDAHQAGGQLVGRLREDLRADDCEHRGERAAKNTTIRIFTLNGAR